MTFKISVGCVIQVGEMLTWPNYMEDRGKPTLVVESENLLTPKDSRLFEIPLRRPIEINVSKQHQKSQVYSPGLENT